MASQELNALIVMTLFFILAWLPSSIAKFKYYGFKWLGSNRTRKPEKEMAVWGIRVENAYQNLKDYFPGFIVAVFAIVITEKTSSYTVVASWGFVISRILHFIVYAFGKVNLRVLTFISSMIFLVSLLVLALL